jgi:hypothetical protein
MGMKTTQETVKNSDNGKSRTELNKSGEIYIYMEREKQNEKKKKGEGLNNVHVTLKKGEQLDKGQVKYVSINLVRSVDANISDSFTGTESNTSS